MHLQPRKTDTKKSNDTALLHTVNNIIINTDSENSNLMYSKAVDLINHSTLFSKLGHIGVIDVDLERLKCYLKYIYIGNICRDS